MRKLIPLLLALLVPVLIGANAMPGMSTERPRFAAHILKIQLSEEAIARTNLPTEYYSQAESFGIGELDELAASYGTHKIIRAHIRMKDREFERRTGFDRWFLIVYDQPLGVLEALKAFKAYPAWIQDASPEFYAYTTVVPNDTYYANNWGHNNTAQLPVYTGGSHSGAGVGTIGFDSDAQLAWDQSQGYGSASIIIAIIDTGVDTAHPDLRLVAGYDYGDNDANPMDNSADPGHGTACSGVAAGRANNALGVTGIAGGCSVMPLKIASSDGSLGFTAINNALTHCGNNGVHVASMSFGAEGGMVEGDSPSTDTALEYAYSNGVTLLAATANSNTSTIAYPSNHNKVISVGAASPTGQRKSTTSSDGENWWGSNYGVATQDNQNAVDVMAPTILPCTDITGTGNGYNTSSDYYMWFNGTSCATPYAAGVAALIKSKDPSLTPAQVRTAMVSTATDMTFDGGAGWDRFTGYGMVNANNALLSLIPGMPSCQITAPTAGTVVDLNSTVTVNVTATDTDGTISNVKFYIDDVLQNTDNASPWTWNWNTTGFSAGSHTIKAVATDNSANTAQATVSVTLLAPPNEGFETGNFSANAWVNTSAVPWTVQSIEKFSGTYAAKSGAIGHGALTDLSITLSVSASGNISFYEKVSTENGYDYLRFFIDGVLQNQWSGFGSWTQHSYAVNAGTRTFLWRYEKDGSVASGSDCAWIDHITFPPTGTFYAPPQNLTATPSHQSVKLDWAAPSSGTPTGYKIYKNGSLLTTVTGLTYTDTAVTNGTSYGYYLKAVYSGGNESDATSTVNATPNAIAPTGLTATAGNGYVSLSWTGTTGREALTEFGTSSRAISGYKIYRNSSALTTLTGTTYVDNGVINETTYSYYVTTVYANPAGESGPSNTANATPTALTPTEVILGSGTSNTITTTASPINVYYESLHGQSVYTASELAAAGVTGARQITQIGFNITGLPSLAMPNFIIRMGHTTGTNAVSWTPAVSLTTHWTSASYLPSATGWNMYTLNPPFEWNGVSNIVVDTAFGDIGSWTQTGSVQYSTVTSGYRYARSDDSDQTNVFTGGTTHTNRPNLKIVMNVISTDPLIYVSPTTMNFGDVQVGGLSIHTFNIQNTGSATLTGSITTPTGYSVVENARTEDFGAFSGSRNVLPFSVNVGQTKSYSLSFAPTAVQSYNGNVVISSNAVNSSTVNIAVTGAGYIPATVTLSTQSIQSSLMPDETDVQSFTIGNLGSQTLIYGLQLQETRYQGSAFTVSSGRNITGSTMVVDAVNYASGSTVDWVFTVTNASTDNEWLEDLYITFPAGVTVNSASTFVGGTGGAMTPDLTSGTGITIHWNGTSTGGWGVIYPNESAVATVNVSVSPGASGNLLLPFQINGDVYGAEPHVLNGEISIPQVLNPIAWLSVDPVSGNVAGGGSDPIDVSLDATGLAPGTYLASILVNSNDPVNPQMTVSVTLEVNDPNQAPEIIPPDVLGFAKNDGLVVDFTPYVSDPDGDPLSLQASGNSNIDVQIDGLNVTFSAIGGWTGSEDITFTVSDGALQASAVINVSSWNTPPWIDLPESWSFVHNSSLQVNLEPYGGDNDGDALEITWSGNTHIQVQLDGLIATFSVLGGRSGGQVSPFMPPPGWAGSETITFTVNDGTEQASDTVLITATNTAPWVNLPETWSFARGGSLQVNLEPYGGDDDGDGLEVTWSGNTNINIELDGLLATFTAPGGWVGSESVTFTVDDGIAQTSDTVEITVTNSAPVIDLPFGWFFSQDTVGIRDLSDFAGDPDSDVLEYSFAGNTHIALSFDGSILTATPEAGWHGFETVTITVSDGYLQASDTWDIVVEHVINSLETPVVTISVAGANLVLEWQDVPDAMYYRVFASSDPYDGYIQIDSTNLSHYELPLTAAKAFYKVIAVHTPPIK